MLRVSPSLTDRDEQILVALSSCIRVLSMDDLVRRFFGEGNAVERYGRARVGELADAGLLSIDELLARPIPDLSTPQIDWNPDIQVEPDFGKVSYRLKQRWTEPPRATEIVSSTKEASRMTGGANRGYSPRASEVTHDLCVGRLWCDHRELLKRTGIEWIGEGELRRERADKIFGGRIPDAILREPGKLEPHTVIDFCGSYSSEKLAAMGSAYSRYSYRFY
ncbi:MAG: hypothetical protein AAF662_05285 [Pseudomonadota bacterium]